MPWAGMTPRLWRLTADRRQRNANPSQAYKLEGMDKTAPNIFLSAGEGSGEAYGALVLTEVIRHMPRIYAEYRKLKAAVRQRRPDVAVLIDFPDVHLRLAETFKR